MRLLLLILLELTILSCSTPKTHEDWAVRCLSRTGVAFEKCVEQWEEWRDEQD